MEGDKFRRLDKEEKALVEAIREEIRKEKKHLNPSATTAADNAGAVPLIRSNVRIKKKAKAPNPLSMKRKKGDENKKQQQDVGGGGGKSRKHRKKKKKSMEGVATS